MQFKHEFGWSGTCPYCGVHREAVEDNLASPTCDIYRDTYDARLWALVAVGALFCAFPLIGLFM